jgi:hypothetical protein
MSTEIQMVYDAEAKRAVLTFANGKTLTVGGVTEDQARGFKEKHAAEFARRDCCLSTVDGQFTRGGTDD